MSNSNVAIKDLGLNALVRELAKSNKTHCKVGLFSEDRSHDNTMNMATLGLLQEDGEGRIPSRDFMKTTAVTYEADMAEKMETFINPVFANKRTIRQALTAVGNIYTRRTKDVIKNFSTPKNARLTISIKGKDDPLVHHGKMMKAVKFKVVGWK